MKICVRSYNALLCYDSSFLNILIDRFQCRRKTIYVSTKSSPLCDLWDDAAGAPTMSTTVLDQVLVHILGLRFCLLQPILLLVLLRVAPTIIRIIKFFLPRYLYPCITSSSLRASIRLWRTATAATTTTIPASRKQRLRRCWYGAKSCFWGWEGGLLVVVPQ